MTLILSMHGSTMKLDIVLYFPKLKGYKMDRLSHVLRGCERCGLL